MGTAVEEALWVRELLRHLGYDMDYATVVENDNKSTISLHTKGPSSSGRTRWVQVKEFWVKAHLENGDIRLEYTASLDLLADGFTKPLEGQHFYAFRARVLNLESTRGVTNLPAARTSVRSKRRRG